MKEAPEEGIRKRQRIAEDVLWLFDALAVTDQNGFLASLRRVHVLASFFGTH